MIVQDNEEIRRQYKSLLVTLKMLPELYQQIEVFLEEGADIDAIEEVRKLDNNMFRIREILFNSKVNSDKIRKQLDKHIAHCLNPIAKTAPKKTKQSARKKKDAPVISDIKTITNWQQGRTTTSFIIENDYDKMNEIMPGKDGHHPMKKHSTISKKKSTIVPVKREEKINNPHESNKPFE